MSVSARMGATRLTDDRSFGQGVALTPVQPNRTPFDPSRRGAVLVVDDDEYVARTITRMLRDQHEVVAVHSAEAALARIRQGEYFDVILCDIHMPRQSGVDLYKAIAQIDPNQLVNVIFLTGGAFTAQTQSFLAQSSNVHIEKPFDMDHLKAVVRDRVR